MLYVCSRALLSAVVLTKLLSCMGLVVRAVLVVFSEGLARLKFAAGIQLQARLA